jgi:hypothetical protein
MGADVQASGELMRNEVTWPHAPNAASLRGIDIVLTNVTFDIRVSSRTTFGPAAAAVRNVRLGKSRSMVRPWLAPPRNTPQDSRSRLPAFVSLPPPTSH